MKITSLTAQIRDPDRVNVSVDGKFRFSLDISQVIDLGVKQGQEIDEARLAELSVESQFGKLYARALEYALMRPRSKREMSDYLYKKTLTKKIIKHKSTRPSAPRTDLHAGEKRARPGLAQLEQGRVVERPGVSEDVAARVLARLQEKGYVDDEKFARYWVENRNQRKGSSLRKLQAELMQKGVANEIATAAFEESDRTDSQELAKIIAKKRRKYPDDDKLKAYLARQGFRYDDIVAALSASDAADDSPAY